MGIGKFYLTITSRKIARIKSNNHWEINQYYQTRRSKEKVNQWKIVVNIWKINALEGIWNWSWKKN